MNSKEQQYIDELIDLIYDDYLGFQRNVEYGQGEIDLIAYRDDGIDIYEVKCRQREGLRKKAHSQLQRAMNKFPGDIQHTYIYYGIEQILEQVT